MNEILDKFREAAIAFGLSRGFELVPDGKLHRVDLEDEKKGRESGWYLLHTDGVPAGAFGSWKSGEMQTWTFKDRNSLTKEERTHLAAITAKSRRERKSKEAEVQAEAQKRAEAIWNSIEAAPDDHPYLARKQVHSHGLRLHRGELLVVPMRDGDGVLWSLQFISPTGEKKFISGSKKRGCYSTIGRPTAQGAIFITEGYATAATIHEVTGEAVVIAFDAGNLEPVAKIMREKFPTREIIIAADNDRFTKKPNGEKYNPGIENAQQAAHPIGARVAVPLFESDEGQPTDFNDLAIREGAQAVLDRILVTEATPTPAETPEPAQAPANTPTRPTKPSTVDFFSPLPDVNNSGKPLSTIENLAEILRRLNVTVRYNVISKEEEILIPRESFSIDNQANASLAWLMSWCGRFKMPVGQVGDFITYLADQNPFNPVATWISSKPWDGKSRLRALYNTVQARGEADEDRIGQMKEILLRRWLISAVAAAFEPMGVSAHGVLVFQGEQYVGKTKWFKMLVPADLRVIRDGMILKPDDRDSVKQVVSNWLVELGELDATFRRSDIAQLKSFLTKDRDLLRRAYARRESEYARRTVFFASVNPKEFLHDPTGNRRYWTIEVESLDLNHKIDVQQVWAEVYELYKSGESWFLSQDEFGMLTESNKDFEARDPIEERIRTRLDWTIHESYWEWKTATDVIIKCGVDKPTQAEVVRAGNIVRALNGGRSKKSNGLRLLYVPGVPEKF